MASSALSWKKGRGKLGILDPLLGEWRAEAESDMGTVICTRSFTKVLNGAYVQLTADWEYESGSYKEISLIGVGPERKVNFWSFTSNKKQSQGELVDVSDIHPDAIGFEPDDTAGFHWVVESKTKKGWTRFAEHHYKAV